LELGLHPKTPKPQNPKTPVIELTNYFMQITNREMDLRH